MKHHNPPVAVITGASRGLGKALAKTFGLKGINVLINYINNKEDASLVVKEIQQCGGTAIAFQADVRNEKKVHQMFSYTIDQWGQIDYLINNAGVTSDKKLQNLSEAEWDQVISTNLTGPANTIRMATPFLVKQKSGHILNIASYAGFLGRFGQANYSASKAGLISLTKSAAKELGPYNIYVNTILPGILDIGMGNRLSESQRILIRERLILPETPPIHQVTEFIYQLTQMNGVSGQLFNLDSRIVI